MFEQVCHCLLSFVCNVLLVMCNILPDFCCWQCLNIVVWVCCYSNTVFLGWNVFVVVQTLFYRLTLCLVLFKQCFHLELFQQVYYSVAFMFQTIDISHCLIPNKPIYIMTRNSLLKHKYCVWTMKLLENNVENNSNQHCLNMLTNVCKHPTLEIQHK